MYDWHQTHPSDDSHPSPSWLKVRSQRNVCPDTYKINPTETWDVVSIKIRPHVKQNTWWRSPRLSAIYCTDHLVQCVPVLVLRPPCPACFSCTPDWNDQASAEAWWRSHHLNQVCRSRGTSKKHGGLRTRMRRHWFSPLDVRRCWEKSHPPET